MLNKEWNDVGGGPTDEGVFYGKTLNVDEGWLDLTNDEWPPV